jgi:hypothetical protein
MLSPEEDIYPDGALSPGNNGSVDLGIIDVATLLHWKDLNDKSAREEMWLGPAPVRNGRPTVEKRWSTEF